MFRAGQMAKARIRREAEVTLRKETLVKRLRNIKFSTGLALPS